MNRNVESHFSELPEISIERSRFDRSSTHKTAFNVGDLIPFYIDEVLPGDTFDVTTSKVVRMSTMLAPIMDNIYLDTYFFFVPMRLVFKYWKEFTGENTSGPWAPSTTYQIPSISAPSGGFAVGTIADYFGLPVGVDWDNSAANRPSALPFRAYALIASEFFRDENLTDPLNIPMDASNQTGTNGSSYIIDVANGGMPFKAAKYHDYFTSCLPAPQKAANPVTIAMQPSSPFADVVTRSVDHFLPPDTPALHFRKSNLTNDFLEAGHTLVSTDNNTGAVAQSSNLLGAGDPPEYVWPSNLYATVGGLTTSFTINELRLAFQLQKYYEKLARGGSRYIEQIKVMFGVTSPDARIQRPEYLGGNRIQLNIHEVTNTAQSSTDFLGDLGAKVATSDIHSDFVKSFSEDGYVIGVCVARYDHSYPQGMEKFWFRRQYTDFYKPVFANIGEQPVEKCQICATAANMATKTTFGYNEAWAEYRFKPDRCSSLMRPNVSGSLAVWNLSDNYAAAPTLSDAWIREDKANVDRTLAVTSATAPQIFADFYIQNFATRPMPMYSIPGLIDHH